MFMAESLMFTKARKLAPKIVILSDFIRKRYGEKDMTNQLKRSATSIGANLAEAHYAESTADLLHKQKIALKEAKRQITRVQAERSKKSSKLLLSP